MIAPIAEPGSNPGPATLSMDIWNQKLIGAAKESLLFVEVTVVPSPQSLVVARLHTVFGDPTYYDFGARVGIVGTLFNLRSSAFVEGLYEYAPAIQAMKEKIYRNLAAMYEREHGS